ncbi:uncharacterized protein [Amphiura filiformis]|uniref:uncharacterized protein n=1 Tax=Amphiura filiformis TaxID=82378 RepID=UPI003B22750E
MKKAIAKELERVSSASSASSVRSSDLSDMNDVEDEEEKQKMMEEMKEEKKEEKKAVKMFRKAISRVLKKQQEPEDWVYDDTIDDSGVVRGSRKKKEFKYLPPKEAVKTMVKMSKGSTRGLTEMITKTDGRGMEWFDEWQKKREEERLEKERLAKENGIDDEEFQSLLKSAKDKLERDERKRKNVTKRKPKVLTHLTHDSSEEETTSEISEIRLQSRNDDNVTKEDDVIETLPTEGWAGFEDPPSSPSELGKIRGVRRVNRLFKEKPEAMQSHLQLVLNTATELQSDKPINNNERPTTSNNSNKHEIKIKHTSIDFLSHYRLIEAPKIEPFGRAFVVEDDDQDCCLEYQELRNALDGVQSLSEIKRKQIEYVLKVLDIDEHTKVTFKMFAVVAAVCERMCSMDPFGKYLVDQSDLMDIERKMTLYKAMFYCNINASEHGANHVSAESIRIELLAGGLNREQERYVMSRMNVNENSEISFFDYMAYIPLFLSMHDNIVDNPLDMTEKYHISADKNAPRDMNPLGLPLKPEFLDAPKEINPSGIPLGKPVLQTQTVEEEVHEEEQEETEKSDTASISLPPSERWSSSSSQPSSGRSLRSMDSALPSHQVEEA